MTAGRTTRAERMAMPLARQVVKDLAAEHGACLRPVQLRRTEIDTGHVEQVLIPCGHTLASVCPSCAERARILRAAQCREGWHLDHEPVIDPDPATEDQRAAVTDRAEAQADRDALASEGLDTGDLDERIGELDEQITDAGLRGKVLPARPRRHRSTKRRQDAAPLPRRTVNPRTVGKTYTAPDGKTFRPSLFVTLTCPSYGRVGEDGAPADPDTYDYTRAARDALHFAALFDRFIQNLRRYTGYDLQYFAAIEPQRRLAPHVHLAIRGTISRAELREVIAATYHQVWWPTQAVKYDGGPPAGLGRAHRHLPRPGHRRGAADLGPGPRRHQRPGRAAARGPVRRPVRRPGRARRIPRRQPVHRLPHQVPDQAPRRLPPGRHRRSGRPRRQARRRALLRAMLADLRELAPLWHPAQATHGRAFGPGACKGKAHRREYLGYAGRRVLVSRKWSGKTLADHRADRRTWLTSALGLPATDPARYSWEPVKPGDPDHMPNGQRLLHVVADRIQWQTALAEARRRADEAAEKPSATVREAA